MLYNLRFVACDLVELMDFELEYDGSLNSRMQSVIIHQNAKALYIVGGDRESRFLKINLGDCKLKIMEHSDGRERREPIALKMSAM